MNQEDVAYWFFRLNGCLTTRNFIVHPEQRRPRTQLTEADLMAVRFPWRREQDMIDHDLFARNRTTLFLVEIKRGGRCEFNWPWMDRSNLMRVLAAVGCYADNEVRTATEELARSGTYESDTANTVLVAIAARRNAELAQSVPGAVQLVWREVLSFIRRRMFQFRSQKAHHPQWDMAGQCLYDAAQEAPDGPARFELIVRERFFRG